MNWTVWSANIGTALGGVVLIVTIVNRYIVKPLRKQFRESIESVVHELQTSDNTTLGATVEHIAADIKDLKNTADSNVRRITAIERRLGDVAP